MDIQMNIYVHLQNIFVPKNVIIMAKVKENVINFAHWNMGMKKVVFV